MNEDNFDDDPFAPNGLLAEPNTRGNANQDTTGFVFDPLLAEFDYDGIPRGPGPAPATDLQTMAEIDSDDDLQDMDGSIPGMVQTTYGAHSWGIDVSQGYRPESMMTADRNMNAMGSDDYVPIEDQSGDPQAGLMPSNEDLDPDTIYDRSSYETGKVNGSGIFDMEEGTTWRPSYGAFAHQYALPDYIGREDEMNVQGSMMWDVTRGAWRVVQPTASGVSLSRIVPGSPNGNTNRYSPFAAPPLSLPATTPRNIERFGREVANTIVSGATTLAPEHRGKFIAASVEALAPGASRQTEMIAQKLVRRGATKEIALHDALAHVVSQATSRDLKTSVEKAKRGISTAGSKLPCVTRLAQRSGAAVGGRIQELRKALLAPAESSASVAQGELGSYYASASKGRLEGLGGEGPAAAATAVAREPGMLTPRNLAIGAAVLGGAFYAYRSGIFKTKTKVGKGAKR